MTSIVAPMCTACVHLHRVAGSRYAPPPWTCDAFPDPPYPTGGRSIPSGILLSRVDHRQPVEGDGGIQFALDPNDPGGQWYMDTLIDPIFAWRSQRTPEELAAIDAQADDPLGFGILPPPEKETETAKAKDEGGAS